MTPSTSSRRSAMQTPTRRPIPRVRSTPRTHRCPACGFRTALSSCPECKTRAGTGRTSIGTRLDGALRKWTLARAEQRCELCDTPASALHGESHLEDAHYVPRRNKATKWHPDNRAALCVGPHERHGGCHRIIDNFTPAHERRAFFVSRRGEAGIAEVDELHRKPWDKDMGAIIRLLIERGVLNAKEAKE